MQPAPSSPDSTKERRNWALTGVGAVADVGGVVLLLSSDAQTLTTVAALIAILVALTLLGKAWGQPVRTPVLAAIGLVAVGAGLLGAVVDRALVGTSNAPTPGVAQPAVTTPPATQPLAGPTQTPASDPGGGSTATFPATTPAEPTIKRQTSQDNPLTLSSSYRADLDSDDPAWDVSSDSDDNIYDISYHGAGSNYPLIANGEAEVAIVEGAANYSTCRNATGYTAMIYHDDVRVGLRFCLKTTDERFAYIVVRDLPKDKKQITLDVAVWNPPLTS